MKNQLYRRNSVVESWQFMEGSLPILSSATIFPPLLLEDMITALLECWTCWIMHVTEVTLSNIESRAFVNVSRHSGKMPPEPQCDPCEPASNQINQINEIADAGIMTCMSASQQNYYFSNNQSLHHNFFHFSRWFRLIIIIIIIRQPVTRHMSAHWMAESQPA